MGYSRNFPPGSVIDPDVVAAIASDPEGYKARKKDLEASIEAAQAAIKEASDKRNELNAREQVLNDRAAELASIEKRINEASEALTAERAAAEAQWAQQRKDNAARSEALELAENTQRAKDVDSQAKNIEAAAALAQANNDRKVAAALRAQLESIVASTSALSTKLAALGKG